MPGEQTSGCYRLTCDRIAAFYDSAIKLLLLPFGKETNFRKGFVDFLAPAMEEKVLDVCSGTGTLSIMIAQKVGPSGTVVGVDLSPNMIRIAKRKTQGSDVEFVLANAELLPFREDTFDKALCSLGMHEMTKAGRKNALKDIRRVLRSSGMLSVYDINTPRRTFGKLLVRVFLRTVEERTAYDMVFRENLHKQIEESGFKIIERKIYFLDILQMISAQSKQWSR